MTQADRPAGVVAVSGAGGGVGRELTTALVGQGATVVGLDIDAAALERLSRALGPSLIPVVGDATTADANDEMAQRCREIGALDGLVCCVGIFDQYCSLTALTGGQLDSAFAEIFDTNVRSALHAVRACAPGLRESRGAIVLTLSGSAFHSEGGGVLYGSTKGALRGALLHLARELAPDVRVNAVAPGGISGSATGGLRSIGQHPMSAQNPERDARLLRRSPLGLLTAAEDVVASYLFLLGAGSDSMTGRTLHPDGGLMLPAPEYTHEHPIG